MPSFAPMSTITVEVCEESIGQSFEASKDCEVSPGRRKDESLNLRIRNHRPIFIPANKLTSSSVASEYQVFVGRNHSRGLIVRNYRLRMHQNAILKPMTVVIAGSTGLVGSALVKAFENTGQQVIGISRKVLDLTDSKATSEFISRNKPEIIVDAAALVGGIAANDSHPVEFLTQNLLIQNNLMAAAHVANVPKFVFLGSSCIYPKDSPQPIKEEYLLTGPLEETNSAYAIAKIAGIEMLNSYRKEFGAKWISVMPSNLYGPSDNFNLETSHVLPALLRKFLEAKEFGKEFVEVWGTGAPRREFLHVDDLASAVLIALENYDSSLHLNVGTGSDISINDLAVKIAGIVGFRGEIKWDTSRPDGTSQKVLDISRISSLGWKPRITLDEGISSTLNWLQGAMETGGVRL